MTFVVFSFTLISFFDVRSKAADTPKPKNPPWLALVQSESKKKTAPLPPTIPSLASSGSASSVKEERSEAVAALNPFDDENDEDDEDGEPETNTEPPLGPMLSNHPWYRITQAAKDTDGDDSAKSPASVERKKRPAPQAPKSTSSGMLFTKCTCYMNFTKLD